MSNQTNEFSFLLDTNEQHEVQNVEKIFTEFALQLSDAIFKPSNTKK
ncbi:MAG TPA: hypothetical protein P5519_06195 [Spirochaetia bacterium]|nr:hypothetical protein [Spirochaetales bacterium]HPD80176.1 hypothetical protein [Spirochaetales bacterium]HQK34933.1 hypothetical protein [Spirochaetales bacterium]HRS65462.1 hypothetical protein [Spirochaetia bacterium]HRV28057.1 hypothetical protein [Spirochaetia bacterium]